jgi:hypothetical protein
MATIGAIEIQMMADLARLRQDMDQAKGIVGTGASQMQAAANGVKAAFAALGLGLSVAGIAAFVKQGIDAADAANEVAQKTGLATKEVAGMQLAFKQGGVSADSMTSGLAKMAKQMVEGNDAFDKLGIKTRNADGTMRSVKDVIYDTADAFAGVKDGAAKTALAMDIFGKTGGDMIPVLNGGSEGLREMAAMADKLGLTIDESTAKAADQFNDQIELIGLGTKGVSTQIAAQLLPTLTSLSASFLETMTSGDTLRKVAEILATALKGLYTGGVLIVEVFNTMGKVIGGAGAAIVAVLNGDFKAAANIGKAAANDIKAGWTSSAQTIARAWDTSGNSAVQSMAAMVKTQKDVTVATKAGGDAAKAAASEAAKHAKEVAELTKKLDGQIATQQQELAQGEKLSAGQKQALDLMIKLRDNTLKLTDAEKQRLAGQLETILANEKTIEANKALAKTLADVAAHTAKAEAAEIANTAKLRESVVALREQNEAAGLTNEQLVQRRAAVDETAAAELEWQAAMQGGNWQLEEQARLLRERAALSRQGVVIKEAQAAADEWKKTTDSIGQGLTDSLYRAFESGKGFFKTLWDGIKNTFKTTVLKMAVDMVMKPVNGVLGGLLGGFGGMANAGSMGGMSGGIGGALGAAGSIFGAGGLAGAMMGGAGWLTGATTLSGALGAAGSLIGTGTAGGVMAGLGMGLGALGPIGIGLALLSSLGGKSTPHLGGTVAADASGVRQVAGASMGWQDQHISTETVTALSGISAGVAAALNGLSQTFGGAGGFGVNAGFAADNKDPSWGYLQILKGGQALSGWSGTGDVWGRRDYAAEGGAGYQQYLADVAVAARAALDTIDMPPWAREMVAALGSNPSIEALAQTAEAIAAKQAADNAPAEQQLEVAQATADNLSTLVDSVASMADRITTAVESLRASVEAGQTAAISTGRDIQRLLVSWDGGGSIYTTAAP